MTDYSIT